VINIPKGKSLTVPANKLFLIRGRREGTEIYAIKMKYSQKLFEAFQSSQQKCIHLKVISLYASLFLNLSSYTGDKKVDRL